MKTMEQELVAGMREVAAAYDVKIDAVTISFDFMEHRGEDGGACWHVVVTRSPVNKRRTSPDRASGMGDTLSEAVASVIERRAFADEIEGRTKGGGR